MPSNAKEPSVGAFRYSENTPHSIKLDALPLASLLVTHFSLGHCRLLSPWWYPE